MKPHPSPYTTILIVIAVIFAVVAAPAVPVLLLIAWLAQRRWKSQRRGTIDPAAQARAWEKDRRDRMLAAKSLP